MPLRADPSVPFASPLVIPSPVASSGRRLGAAAGPLAEAEDDELGGLHWRQADLDNQLAAVPHVRRVELLVALDVVGFLRCPPEQSPVAPDASQERSDIASDPRPEVGIVRLEHDPLCAALDRL